MADNANKPVAAAAKPADATPTPATTTPPRHDPVPVAADTAKPVAPKPAVVAEADSKPAKAASAPSVPKAAVAAKPAATAVPETRRKRGRPLGSKSKTVAKPATAKSPAARSPAAKSTAAKPAAKPVSAKPIKTPTKPVAPLAASTINKGSKTMTDTITKIQDTAKKFTGEAGARTQALFGDMSTQAKGAYEKSVKLTEEFTAFQKGNVEAIVESSKLAAKAAETLGQEAADYARKSFETTTAAFKTFASAKSPTELFKLQSDYFKSYFDSAVAESSKVTEAWLKLAGEVTQPLSNRVAVAVEKAKATTAI